MNKAASGAPSTPVPPFKLRVGDERAAEDALSRAHVERSYRRYAPLYDVLFGASLGPGRHAMAQLVRRIEPRNILEVGVGTGLALPQYPREARITGIDLSCEMLAVAQRRVPQADEARIALRVMDAERMEFDDGTFDCVTLPYVLSVTPDPDRLVAEVCRVCRPNGHIVIVNHFSGQPTWRAMESLLGPLAKWLGFRSQFTLEQHILRHSWQVLSVESTNVLALSKLIHICNV